MDRPEWIQESNSRSFAYPYVDKETGLTCEEEKKMKVARPRDSLPFGMHIRKAAHSAIIGEMPAALSRYLPVNKVKDTRLSKVCQS